VVQENNHRAVNLFRRATCLVLAASLLVTSAPGLEAVVPWAGPNVAVAPHDPSYLTQQALVSRMVSNGRRISTKLSFWKEYKGRGLQFASQTGTTALAFQLPSDNLEETIFKVLLLNTAAAVTHALFRSRILGKLSLPSPCTTNCGIDVIDYTFKQPRPIGLTQPALPDAVAKMSLAQGEITTRRGGHEAGAAIKVYYKDNNGLMHSRLIIVKVVSDKRERLAALLDEEIDNALRLENLWKRGIYFLPTRVTVVKQFRYSTSSDPTIIDEAHIHVGEAERTATMYRYENGVRIKTTEHVLVGIGHNGDMDGIIKRFDDIAGIVLANGEFISEGALRIELLGYMPNPHDPTRVHRNFKLKGDTPTAAMELTFRRTRFDAFASLRYARRDAVARRYRAKFPLPESLLEWTKEFEAVIDELPAHVDLATLTKGDIKAIKARIIARFQDRAKNDVTFWPDIPQDQIEPVINYAVHVFLHNSLAVAMKSFSQEAISSFGVGAISSVDENPVYLANGQGFSLARNRKTGRRAANSAALALNLETTVLGEPKNPESPDYIYEERLDPDFTNGQVIEQFEDGHVGIYSIAENRYLSLEETEALWFPIKESPYTGPTERYDASPDGARKDLQEGAAALAALDESMSNPDSYNRTWADNIADRFIELAYQHNDKGLPLKAHVLFTGFFTEAVQADLAREIFADVFPEIGRGIVADEVNQLLVDPDGFAAREGVTTKTTAVVFDTYGERAPSLTAAALLTRQTHYVFGLNGGRIGNHDNPMARVVLGQGMHPPSRLQGNTGVSGARVPRTQAEIIPTANTFAMTNHLLYHVMFRLRQEFPDPNQHPLGMTHTLAEIAELIHTQEQVREEVAEITGVQADGRVAPVSTTQQQIAETAEFLEKEITEPRVLRFVYRFVFLFPLIVASYKWNFHPSSLFLPMAGNDWVSSLFYALVDLFVYTVFDKVIVTALRKYQQRQVGSRMGGLTLGISFLYGWLLLEDVWHKLFGLAHPDAFPTVMSADPVGRVGSHFVNRWKPLLNRKSIILNFQIDDRINSVLNFMGAIKMTSTQSKVEKSLPFMKVILFLNRFLEPMDMRIPFAGVRTITLGRSWSPNANAEDRRIELPTVTMPLPLPVSQFLRVFERQHDIVFTGKQRGQFMQFLIEKKHEPDNDAFVHGHEAATRIGVPEKLRGEFADAYIRADGSLYHYSAEDIRSYERMAKIWMKRVNPISQFYAGAALGVETAMRVNNPKYLKHRTVPTGATQSKALIDTTADTVSLAPAMEIVRSRPNLAAQVDLSKPVLKEPKTDILTVQSVMGAEGSKPVALHTMAVKVPQKFRLDRNFRTGMSFKNVTFWIKKQESGIRFKVRSTLVPIGSDATVEIVLLLKTGQLVNRFPLSRFENTQWQEISIQNQMDQKGVTPAMVTGIDFRVKNSRGTLQVVGLPGKPTVWVHEVVLHEERTEDITSQSPELAPAVAPNPRPIPYLKRYSTKLRAFIVAGLVMISVPFYQPKDNPHESQARFSMPVIPTRKSETDTQKPSLVQKAWTMIQDLNKAKNSPAPGSAPKPIPSARDSMGTISDKDHLTPQVRTAAPVPPPIPDAPVIVDAPKAAKEMKAAAAPKPAAVNLDPVIMAIEEAPLNGWKASLDQMSEGSELAAQRRAIADVEAFKNLLVRQQQGGVDKFASQLRTLLAQLKRHREALKKQSGDTSGGVAVLDATIREGEKIAGQFSPQARMKQGLRKLPGAFAALMIGFLSLSMVQAMMAAPLAIASKIEAPTFLPMTHSFDVVAKMTWSGTAQAWGLKSEALQVSAKTLQNPDHWLFIGDQITVPYAMPLLKPSAVTMNPVNMFEPLLQWMPSSEMALMLGVGFLALGLGWMLLRRLRWQPAVAFAALLMTVGSAAWPAVFSLTDLVRRAQEKPHQIVALQAKLRLAKEKIGRNPQVPLPEEIDLIDPVELEKKNGEIKARLSMAGMKAAIASQSKDPLDYQEALIRLASEVGIPPQELSGLPAGDIETMLKQAEVFEFLGWDPFATHAAEAFAASEMSTQELGKHRTYIMDPEILADQLVAPKKIVVQKPVRKFGGNPIVNLGRKIFQGWNWKQREEAVLLAEANLARQEEANRREALIERLAGLRAVVEMRAEALQKAEARFRDAHADWLVEKTARVPYVSVLKEREANAKEAWAVYVTAQHSLAESKKAVDDIVRSFRADSSTVVAGITLQPLPLLARQAPPIPAIPEAEKIRRFHAERLYMDITAEPPPNAEAIDSLLVFLDHEASGLEPATWEKLSGMERVSKLVAPPADMPAAERVTLFKSNVRYAIALAREVLEQNIPADAYPDDAQILRGIMTGPFKDADGKMWVLERPAGIRLMFNEMRPWLPQAYALIAQGWFSSEEEGLRWFVRTTRHYGTRGQLASLPRMVQLGQISGLKDKLAILAQNAPHLKPADALFRVAIAYNEWEFDHKPVEWTDVDVLTHLRLMDDYMAFVNSVLPNTYKDPRDYKLEQGRRFTTAARAVMNIKADILKAQKVENGKRKRIISIGEGKRISLLAAAEVFREAVQNPTVIKTAAGFTQRLGQGGLDKAVEAATRFAAQQLRQPVKASPPAPATKPAAPATPAVKPKPSVVVPQVTETARDVAQNTAVSLEQLKANKSFMGTLYLMTRYVSALTETQVLESFTGQLARLAAANAVPVNPEALAAETRNRLESLDRELVFLNLRKNMPAVQLPRLQLSILEGAIQKAAEKLKALPGNPDSRTRPAPRTVGKAA